MWSGAVAHLHQGSMCSVFKDTLLHTLVLRDDYLLLSLSSQLKEVCPFSSATHWNHRGVCLGKTQQISSFLYR